MKYNITSVHRWICYGIDRNWSPQVIKDTVSKNFKINIRISYIMRFYTSP